MTKTINRVLVIISMLYPIFGSNGAIAQDASQITRGFDLVIRLHDGGRLVGTPQLTVRDGATARVTVPGAGGYSLTVRIEGSSNGRGNAASVSAEVQLFVEGRWRHVASPVISVGESGAGTMILAADADNPHPFRMDIEVRARALTAAEAARIRPCPAQPLLTRASVATAGTQDATCCSTPCLQCCGGAGVCCADPHRCRQGCCVADPR